MPGAAAPPVDTAVETRQAIAGRATINRVDGSTKAIVAALGANAGIAAAKFAGFLVTGSSAMLAEAVHSVADMSNQGLLLHGRRVARKDADALHSFGHGRSRYFWSFVVALVIFAMGAVFALYEGSRKLVRPQPLSTPGVALTILAVAILMELYSFHTAWVASRPLRGGRSWWRFIRESRNPELPIVILEDTAALIGLVLALGAVGLSVLTGSAVWDGVGTIAIGGVLATVSILLMSEMHSLLLGESATAAETSAIREALLATENIQRVIHLKTQYLGPEQMLVVGNVAFAPDLDIASATAAIGRAEARIRAAVPIARIIYLQPCVDGEM